MGGGYDRRSVFAGRGAGVAGHRAFLGAGMSNFTVCLFVVAIAVLLALVHVVARLCCT